MIIFFIIQYFVGERGLPGLPGAPGQQGTRGLRGLRGEIGQTGHKGKIHLTYWPRGHPRIKVNQ